MATRAHSFLLLFVFLMSCTSGSEMNFEQYVKWYQSSAQDIKPTKTIGDYTFKAEYRPKDLMVLSELMKSGDVSEVKFDSLIQDFAGMEYFIFRIGTSDPSNDVMSFNIRSKEEYYERVRYFSEMAQNDFLLVNGYDTISCGLFHLERTYNTAPFNNILLGFEVDSVNKQVGDLKLLFNDNILGNGLIIFSFSKDALIQIPQLKF